jgi:hypothetical protein
MLAFWFLMLRRRVGSELAHLLWAVYFSLGLSAILIDATDVLPPVFEPNIAATGLLLLCVLVFVSGFLSFQALSLRSLIDTTANVAWLERLMIVGQLYAIAFFTPLAISSLSGDPDENRLALESKMELMNSYGLFNTFAGFAAQLFTVSLLLAFIRLARSKSKGDINIRIAQGLIASSLSYVVYILAYVGRDGFVFWLMSAAANYVIFRPHLPRRLRSQIVLCGLVLIGLMSIPFAAITAARFANMESGISWSLLEYFGRQINHFSDFASIERPMTFGLMNFPMFAKGACEVVGIQCERWVELKPFVFEQYLAQGKEPWLFATLVSDFIGDFGIQGTVILVGSFAISSHWVGRNNGAATMTLSRLLLLMLMFLIPYWGVFYFRFGIGNSAILLHLGLVIATWAFSKGKGGRPAVDRSV